MTIPVISRDNQILNLPPEEAAAEFLAGNVSLPPGTRIPVRLPAGGGFGDIAPEDAQGALRNGFHFAEPEDLARAEREARASGVTGEFLGERFASGFTGGFTDLLGAPEFGRLGEALEVPFLPPEAALGRAVGLVTGEEDPERRFRRQFQREESPIIGGGAEAAGVLTGALTGALPGRAALAGGPAGIATALGLGAERAIQGRVGRGLAARALASGTAGAIEGAAVETGILTREAAFTDQPITGEMLVAALGRGALLGGATGAIFGAAAPVTGRAIQRIRQRLREAVSPGELSFTSLGPNASQFRDAANRAGGAERIGRQALRGHPSQGQRWLASSAEETATRSGEGMRRFGEDVGGAVRSADEVMPLPVGTAERIERAIRSRVLDPVRGTALQNPVNNAVRQAMGPFAERFGAEFVVGAGGRVTREARETLTHELLHTVRRNLDSVIFPKTGLADVLPAVKGHLRTIRTILEDELQASIGRAGAQIGVPLRTQYDDAKLGYESARLVNRISRNRMRSPEPFFSIGDLGPVFLGGLVGGGGFGSAALAVLAGGANRFMRKHWRRMAAIGLDKVSRRMAVADAVATTSRSLDEAVQGLLNPRRAVAARPVTVGRFGEEVDRIRREGANIDAFAERLQEDSEGLAQSAPITTAALMTALTRGSVLVQGSVPAGTVAPGTLQAHLQDAGELVSDVEKAQFLLVLRTVEEPSSALEDLRDGNLTVEQSDALRTVYPLLYAELTQRVMQELIEKRDRLPYEARLNMGILFPELPTDPSLEPSYLRMLQERSLEQTGAQIGGAIQAAQQTQPNVPAPAPRLDESQRTPAQSQEA